MVPKNKLRDAQSLLDDLGLLDEDDEAGEE